MGVNTQQITGSICTFCLLPIQLTYFYISDGKQKITLTLERKENRTFCLKLGKKKQIKVAINTLFTHNDNVIAQYNERKHRTTSRRCDTWKVPLSLAIC